MYRLSNCMSSFLRIFAFTCWTKLHLSPLRSSSFNQLPPLPEKDFQKLNHMVIQTLTLSIFFNIHAVLHYTYPNVAHTGSC